MISEHGLTQQREKFAAGVAAGLTQADAYRAAFKNKMTAKQIHEEASKMAAIPKVAQRIKALQQAAAERVILKLEDLMEETRRVALSTPAGIIDLTDPKKPRVKLPHELDAATAAAISSFEIDDLGRIRYKFWDKNSSLERMAKMLGAFERDNAQKNPVAELLASLAGNVAGPGSALTPEGADDDE